MSTIHGVVDNRTHREYVDWQDLRSFIFEHLGTKGVETDQLLRDIVKAVDKAVEDWTGKPGLL